MLVAQADVAYLLVVLGLFSIYVGLVLYFSIHTKEKERRDIRTEMKIRDTLFKCIIEGLRNGSLNSLEVLENVYDGTLTQETSEPFRYWDMSKHLRELEARVAAKDPQLGLREVADDVIKRYVSAIHSFVKASEQEPPYESLPPPEKQILLDAQSFIKDKDEEGALRKVNELVASIVSRENEMRRLGVSAKRANTLTFISIIVTIVSIVVGLALVFSPK